MPNHVLAVLQKASSGLLYPSESDEPFDAFCWEGDEVSPREKVAALAATDKAAGKKKKTKVEEISIEDFFGELVQSDDAKKFQQLEEVLRFHLTNLKVFRVGEVRVDVYVVGRDKTTGKWTGVHTVSVET